MKQEIHPKVHPVMFIDTSCDVEFKTMSTITSEETREVDGVKYYVVNLEVTSASHPFYTGKQRFVDTAGQVDKYQKRVKKAEEAKSEHAHTSKKAKRKAKDSNTKQTKQDAKAALKSALKG